MKNLPDKLAYFAIMFLILAGAGGILRSIGASDTKMLHALAFFFSWIVACHLADDDRPKKSPNP